MGDNLSVPLLPTFVTPTARVGQLMSPYIFGIDPILIIQSLKRPIRLERRTFLVLWVSLKMNFPKLQIRRKYETGRN